MSEHKITLEEKKEVNDQHVAFRYRCCDDPSTDSWVTLDLSADANEVIAGFQTAMAHRHEHKVKFRAGDHPTHRAAVEEATVNI